MDAPQASQPERLTDDPANNLVPNKGKLWRFAATVGAWLEALDYSSFDYTQDRIDRLERKVVELTEELRHSRASSARDSAPQ
jgi:hypothetical protein